MLCTCFCSSTSNDMSSTINFVQYWLSINCSANCAIRAWFAVRSLQCIRYNHHKRNQEQILLTIHFDLSVHIFQKIFQSLHKSASQQQITSPLSKGAYFSEQLFVVYLYFLSAIGPQDLQVIFPLSVAEKQIEARITLGKSLYTHHNMQSYIRKLWEDT